MTTSRSISQRAILRRAFDLGITHFDLANNYGPPYGSAESNFGRILRSDFRDHRDELVISTKAGWDMWPGPYGDLGSRKYLLASLDQSLSRLGVDYVDIFYHHRFDPDTPLEESLGALHSAVQQGKALYIGISSYSGRAHAGGHRHPQSARHPASHPPAFVLDAQPMDRRGPSRRARDPRRRVHCLFAVGTRSPHRPIPGRHPRRLSRLEGRLSAAQMLSDDNLTRVACPDAIAQRRGQPLAQMALAWALRDARVTSVLIGASSVTQLEQNVSALDHLGFSADELAEIDRHAVEAGVDLWRTPATS